MPDYEIKHDSEVQLKLYNNYIMQVCNQYKEWYLYYIKDITEEVSKIVNTKKWTDGFSEDYANWYNDTAKEANGVNKLNKALKRMDELLEIVCIKPMNSLAKQLGGSEGIEKGVEKLRKHPMLLKAYNAKGDLYALLEVKKYRKENFPPIAKASSDTISVNKEAVSAFLRGIKYNVEHLKETADKIEQLTKTYILGNRGESMRCIHITGFSGLTINSKMDEIRDKLTEFLETSTEITNKTIEGENTTAEQMVNNLDGESTAATE